ncbi:hypothetical protein ABID16_000497 [Rhizobium aquaticum]|uniref:Uncharacterized protein n=1 Tax=Rhizobium aquaticum TaxID=1549636 RepID=A0ABV2IUP4_9HYPH
MLVHNERTKLAANALDRLSTAFVVVGVLGRTFNYSPGADMWIGLLGVATWILGAFILHLIARRILGGLVP